MPDSKPGAERHEGSTPSTSTMTRPQPERYAAIISAINEVQVWLSMEDWDIQYVWEYPDGDDCYGAVDVVPEYKTIELFIHPKIEDKDLRGTVVHELLHALLWEFSTAADILATSDLEREYLRLAEERFIHRLEQSKAFARSQVG